MSMKERKERREGKKEGKGEIKRKRVAVFITGDETGGVEEPSPIS